MNRFAFSRLRWLSLGAAFLWNGGCSSPSEEPPPPSSQELCAEELDPNPRFAFSGERTRGGHGEFALLAALSPEMPTVIVVDWSIDRPIARARIEFGRDPEAPEYDAAAELTREGQSTLLLGLKQGTGYTFRIVAEDCSGEVLVSEEASFTTGYLSNLAPHADVSDEGEGELYEGFTVLCNGYGDARQVEPNGATSWAFILDKDGDLVWAHDLTSSPEYGCSRARLSHDGRYIWMGNSSFARPNGALRRMTLDGREVRDYLLPGRHHDFTVLPDGHILYQRQQNGGGGAGATEGADDILELDPETGESTLLYDQNTDFAAEIAEKGAHTNYISYVPELEAFSFSMLYLKTVALVSYPEGELLGVWSGPRDEYGVSWNMQHGHHFTGNRLVVFNNWITSNSSGMLEFEYDLAEKTAGPIEQYQPEDPIGTIAFGDVQRLPNGNTLVTFSSNGVIHEIDADRRLLRAISLADPVGYATRQKSLYGPPPHLNEETRPRQ